MPINALERKRSQQRAYQKQWRLDHPGYAARLQREHRRRITDRIAGIKVDRGCIDCGYKEHPQALDFDHVRGEKVDSISQMIVKHYSWARVESEMDKCEVRCKNCHAVRTAERRES